MTDTAPAAATGSPNAFDRRSFLATLAAAGVVTAGATMPAAAADHPDAALLEMVSALLIAEARWRDFDRKADVIFSRLEALAPKIPPALVYQPSRDTFEICEEPKKLEKVEIAGKWVRCYTKEADVPSLRWAVGIWRREGTGRNVVERAEEIIAALDAYIPAVKRAEEVSGVTAHEEGIAANAALIDRLNREIASLPAFTADGVAAKARAVAVAWSSDLTYLGAEELPKMLRGEGVYKRTEILLAVSVVVDAMKLGAAHAPASCRERSAA